MANYSVAKAKHVTTGAAGTQDKVTVTGPASRVEVKNYATNASDIYFKLVSSTDSSTITVGADDTYIVSPGEALQVPAGYTPDVVKLISATAFSYSVTGLQ